MPTRLSRRIPIERGANIVHHLRPQQWPMKEIASFIGRRKSSHEPEWLCSAAHIHGRHSRGSLLDCFARKQNKTKQKQFSIASKSNAKSERRSKQNNSTGCGRAVLLAGLLCFACLVDRPKPILVESSRPRGSRPTWRAWLIARVVNNSSRLQLKRLDRAG